MLKLQAAVESDDGDEDGLDNESVERFPDHPSDSASVQATEKSYEIEAAHSQVPDNEERYDDGTFHASISKLFQCALCFIKVNY